MEYQSKKPLIIISFILFFPNIMMKSLTECLYIKRF
nr:MAG TPA: hypothetical protein [Caudoviricetes sp.]